MSEDAFTLHRSLLFTVAYEMLGSASDADARSVQSSRAHSQGVPPAETGKPSSRHSGNPSSKRSAR
jgi:hypothetical protein